MGVNGMAGVPTQFLVPMESVCGKILDGVGPLCLVTFCMKLEMVKSAVLARLVVWNDISC